MSSLKDLASLIMIPSLYKDGELHTVKPLADENVIVHPDATDNNDGFDGSTPSTSSNFTFSRGSNLAATRVDVNGLIEKGRENVLLQSNQFDTTWSKTLSSVIGNQSGYNGSNDAWKMISGASGTYSIVSQSYSGSGVHTLSLYAKAAEWNYVALFINGSGGASKGAIFDLTTGELTNTIFGSPISYSSNSVGDGWWRLSVTLTGTITGANIYLCEVGTSHTSNANDGSSGIYIQDAQLEQGLVATDYIETGTSAAQSGILEDMPRLDYSGGASCPALLLEPQRTNEFSYSEYFSGWSTAGGTITRTNNATKSPEGVDNATRVVSSSTGARMRGGNVSVTSGEKWTYSIFAKENTTDSFIMRHEVSQNFSVTFDLGDESFTGSGDWYDNAAIEDYGDGWYRCIVYLTADSTENRSFELVFVNNDDLYFYGAQVELGSYPTSYIPTYGTSQTRSADDCITTNISSLLGAEQGTFFVELARIESYQGIYVGNSNFTNRISLYPRNNSTTITYIVTANSTQVLREDPNLSGVDTNDFNKYAFTWSSEYWAVFVNGTKISSGTLSALPNGIDRVELGLANHKQTLLFPTALTDSECIALTTL